MLREAVLSYQPADYGSIPVCFNLEDVILEFLSLALTAIWQSWQRV